MLKVKKTGGNSSKKEMVKNQVGILFIAFMRYKAT